MLQFHYSQPERTTTSPAMSAAMNFNGRFEANIRYAALGLSVGKRLGWIPKHPLDVLVHFRYPDPERECHWEMRGRLAAALEALGWVADASDFDLNPGEMPGGTKLFEGAIHPVAVNAFERNPEARRLCLAHYGTSCLACGINLKATYELDQEFIHVHHIVPLAEVGEKYEIDPVKDLRPVCPNCHSVIHMLTPPYSVEEVKAMVTVKRGIRKARLQE
jgi:predicted HNH restriction endonuclease